MTRISRFLVPTLVVAAATLTGAVAWAGSASSAATPTVYSYTVAGTDAHTLDPHVLPIFVPGGGTQAVDVGSVTATTLRILEVGLDLPVGAKVTSIAVTYTSCPGPSIVFGSYSPTTRNTLQTATLNPPRSCSPRTATKTGNPITTTVAGRRYELDYDAGVGADYPGNADAAFYGATVKYTCTSPCVP